MRLKSQFILGTLSNGNVALLVNMAKAAGLPWDVILGAEPAQAYKPMAQAYLTSVDWLGLTPGEAMMCSAHNSDLLAARACGLRTAFIARPTEYGLQQDRDCRAEHDFDVVSESVLDGPPAWLLITTTAAGATLPLAAFGALAAFFALALDRGSGMHGVLPAGTLHPVLASQAAAAPPSALTL